jgi:hypothetical protein
MNFMVIAPEKISAAGADSFPAQFYVEPPPPDSTLAWNPLANFCRTNPMRSNPLQMRGLRQSAAGARRAAKGSPGGARDTPLWFP